MRRFLPLIVGLFLGVQGDQGEEDLKNKLFPTGADDASDVSVRYTQVTGDSFFYSCSAGTSELVVGTASISSAFECQRICTRNKACRFAQFNEYETGDMYCKTFKNCENAGRVGTSSKIYMINRFDTLIARFDMIIKEEQNKSCWKENMTIEFGLAESWDICKGRCLMKGKCNYLQWQNHYDKATAQVKTYGNCRGATQCDDILDTYWVAAFPEEYAWQQPTTWKVIRMVSPCDPDVLRFCRGRIPCYNLRVAIDKEKHYLLTQNTDGTGLILNPGEYRNRATGYDGYLSESLGGMYGIWTFPKIPDSPFVVDKKLSGDWSVNIQQIDWLQVCYSEISMAKWADESFFSCFPGEATANVEGHRVVMADVQVGDRVQVEHDGKLAYEPVLGFLHALSGQSSYLTITHAHGEFRASASHVVFVAAGEVRTDRLVADVTVGDNLVVSVGETTVSSEVLAVRREAGNSGMYAPLTAAGTIVVDGVVASNYATPSSDLRLPHSTAHAMFFPVRMYHKFGGASKSNGALLPFADFVYNNLQLGKAQQMLAVS